jgi:hypothetical protein
MSKVVPFALEEALNTVDSVLYECFCAFDESDDDKDNIVEIEFNLHGSCDSFFLREIIVELREEKGERGVWRADLSRTYIVTKIILVGPWELLDKFKNVVLSKKYRQYLYFKLDKNDD